MNKALLTIFGCFCFGLGFLGIFLPLLPTVPLWLLSAGCFARSSPRLHSWLCNHRHFGPVIKQWQNDRRIPQKLKRRIIITIWLSLGLSMIIIAKLWLCLMLAMIGLVVSTYIWRLPQTPSSS